MLNFSNLFHQERLFFFSPKEHLCINFLWDILSIANLFENYFLPVFCLVLTAGLFFVSFFLLPGYSSNKM